MKKTLSKFIQPTIAIVALVLVVSAASAWMPPSQLPTGGNVWAPLNTGPNAQTKSGNLWSDSSIFAGTNIAAGDSAYITNFINSAKARFGCPNPFGCSADTASNILNAGFHNSSYAMTKGIAVDLDGSFYVKDGNQAAAKVLTSDANGKATWSPLPAAPTQATINKLEVYRKNPSCLAFDGLRGEISMNDRCYASPCEAFNGTDSLTGFAACWPVDANHNLELTNPFPAAQYGGLNYHPTPPYACSSGLSIAGIPVVAQQYICYNQKIGYIIID